MKWVKYLLKNRLITYLAAFSICLLGLFSLFYITIAPIPAFTSNQIMIQLFYPGANANTVQSQVTSKVENALSGIPNIVRISANTFDGSANIELSLDSIQPIQLLETRIKILQAIASSHLPSNIPQATITQESGGSGLLNYQLTSNQLSLFQINNFIHAKLMPKFSAIPGVVIDTGNQNPVIHIRLYPNKLSQYKINTQEVIQRLNNAFKAAPLGTIYLDNHPYLLGLSGNIQTLQDFKHLIVGYQGQNTQTGSPIYLKDISSINFSPRSLLPNFYSSFNGQKSEDIDLATTTHANPFEVSRIAQNYIKKISSNLPADLKITLINNIALYMHKSFTEVAITILIAAALVLLVALIFLGRFRTTLVPIATIPVCLLGTVGVLACMGLSLNILSLLAMVIAVGLVVDDSIVVVENITRHVELGMNKYDAVLQGTSEIALTVIGITATLLAVYLPISFYSGALITFLKAFSVPLAIAVFISGIAALSLTPIMCNQLISTKPPNPYQNRFNQLLNSIISIYHKALKIILNAPWISLATIILLIIAGIYFDLKIPQNLFPADPSGKVIITAHASPQDTITTLNNKFKPLSKFYKNKYVKNYSTQINQDPTNGQITGRLSISYKDQYLHENKQFTDNINAYFKAHQMHNLSVRMGLFASAGGNADLEFAVYGSDNIAKVNQKAALLTAAMKHSAIFSYVSNSINQPKKQLAFKINTGLAAKFGLYRSNITNLLGIYFGGYQLDNFFNIDGLSVPVLLQLDRPSLQDPNILQQLQIASPTSKQYFPLSKFVSLNITAKPTVISSMDGQPSVTIQANLAKGHALSDAIPYVNKLMHDKAGSLSYQYLGNALSYLQGNTQSILVACLGIIAIYLMLAILFKNLIDPFIILLTVPFTVVSGALSLYLYGDSLNLYSTLALITLVGLITKHGVLIVQFANHTLHQGGTVYESILTSTRDRFRPIIMTTLVMSLGALPLLLSQSPMYVARRDLGMVLISGLMIGTIFSLFIVPLVYTLVKRAETHK